MNESNAKHMSRRSKDRALGIILFLCGTLIAAASWQLGLHSEGNMGPGFFPLLASGVVAIAGVVVVLRPQAEDVELFISGEAKRVIGGVLLALVYIVIFLTLGYLQATFLIVTSWLKLLAHETWKTSLAFGFISTVVVHLIFIVLLDLNLPRDWFLGR